MTQEQKALEILRAIAELSEKGESLTIAHDWGFGSATLINNDGAHTHFGCDSLGSADENFAEFVNQLHSILIIERGLSFVKLENNA